MNNVYKFLGGVLALFIIFSIIGAIFKFIAKAATGAVRGVDNFFGGFFSWVVRIFVKGRNIVGDIFNVGTFWSTVILLIILAIVVGIIKEEIKKNS